MDSFCYLGDNITAGGGYEASTVTRIRAAMGKFQGLLPIFGSKSLSFTYTWQSLLQLCQECNALCMRVLASETNGSGSASEELEGNAPLDVCRKTY